MRTLDAALVTVISAAALLGLEGCTSINPNQARAGQPAAQTSQPSSQMPSQRPKIQAIDPRPGYDNRLPDFDYTKIVCMTNWPGKDTFATYFLEAGYTGKPLTNVDAYLVLASEVGTETFRPIDVHTHPLEGRKPGQRLDVKWFLPSNSMIRKQWEEEQRKYLASKGADSTQLGRNVSLPYTMMFVVADEGTIWVPCDTIPVMWAAEPEGSVVCAGQYDLPGGTQEQFFRSHNVELPGGK